jgi:eukaryotic-like serine/threonine-protein kinase
MSDIYVKVSKLGKGAFGETFLAYKGGQKIALKEIKISNDKIMQMAEKEVGLLTQLSKPTCHPAIVCYYGYRKGNQKLYIEMEYIEGKTLHEFAKEYRNDPRFYQLLVSIIKDITKGLQYIHSRGIIHRDISTGNIIITPKYQPKLIDFGLSCYIKEDTCSYGGKPLSCCKGFAGTLQFSAPEVVLNNTSYFSSDIFSLGACIYYVATGQYIYDSYGGFKNQERLKYLQEYANIQNLSTPNNTLNYLVNSMLIKDPIRRITAKQILEYT